MRRRRLLAAVGVGSLGGLAGCTGEGLVDGGATDSGSESDSGSEAGSESGSESGSDADSTPDWPSGSYADYDTTTVEVQTADGDRLGTVNAAIADTGDKRYLGLSDASTLPEDAGMLFVFSAEREDVTFVMREMDFGIDIVYADAEGRITRIHNAPEPGPNENGSEQRYPGSGRYVLEVPYKWTDRNSVAVGDVLAFER
ncbi:hypothetical protein C461_06484 [Halorubrum aidingense JCM 13560]|uniref:DUF192 domain-containing protein n=1 Tax=Halorubrum aidingense JCM 13560 TaxID=1230454 RepID=M0PDJ3_9EURY|nr:DUF192 domain-containing protein [Halorubrum aidingense]EMA68207.1 hypothetical protein C461_06484 [Halorubrum aidingense JCM 13560]